MRRSATAPFVLLVTLVGSTSAVAQPPPPQPPLPESPPPFDTNGAPTSTPRVISIADAMAYAHANQPAIRAALSQVKERGEAAKIPTAQWLPHVGITGQLIGGTTNNTTASYITPSFMDIPRIGGTSRTATGTLTPYPSTFVGLGLNQEIFDFGRISAQRAAADLLIDVAKQSAAIARLDIDFGVEESYFAVFAAKSVLTASEDAYQRAKVHRDLAKAGVDSGLRSPIELTRAEADLGRFDVGRIRARGGVATAESVLAASIGAPDAALDVTAEPPPINDMPALGTAMKEVSTRDPFVLRALAQLKADEEKTRAIGAEMRPDLSLSSTLSGRAGGAPPGGIVGTTNEDPATGGWLPVVPNWDVGLILNWPIFDGTVVARRDASRAEEQVRRDEISLAREQEVAAIEQGYVAFEVARSAVPALQRSVGAAKANYAQADARFRAGMGNAVELADAEALLTDAEIQLALGMFEVARTRAVFGRAIAEGL